MLRKFLLFMADAPAGGNGGAAAAPAAAGDKAAGDAAGAAAAPPADDKPDTAVPDNKTKDPFSALKKEEQPPEKRVAVKRDPVVEQRKRIEEQNKLLADAIKERDDWKTKASEFEKKHGGDSTALLAKQKEMEAEVARLRGEIAVKDYSKHPDFQKNYEKPFADSAEHGKKVIESLEVIEKDADGNVKPRPADWSRDFAPIYNLPRAAARAAARERFGEDAPEVMQRYDELHRLAEAKDKALGEWQSTADQREQASRAEQLEKTAKDTELFHAATSDMINARPEVFQDNPEDAEENELRKNSMNLVDAAYFQRDKLAPKELLVLDAAVRLRAAHYPVLEHRLNKVTAELAEYKARLDGKEASMSGKTRKIAQSDAPAQPEDWQSDLKKSLAT